MTQKEQKQLPKRGKTSAAHSERDSFAARYKVIRRVTPFLRHHMIRQLHPIALLGELLNHSLNLERIDIQAAREAAYTISSLTKTSIAEVSSTATWLVPDCDETVSLSACVEECCDLLNGSFGFRGYQLLNEVGGNTRPVPRDAIRICLAASLLAASDAATRGTAQLIIRPALESEQLWLKIIVEPGNAGACYFDYEEAEAITWDDVKTLAASVGVQVSIGGDEIALRLPEWRWPHRH